MLTYTLASLPTGLLMTLTIGSAVLLAVAGLALVRRFRLARDSAIPHELAGQIYHALAVFYAIVLGFMVVLVWEQRKVSIWVRLVCPSSGSISRCLR